MEVKNDETIPMCFMKGFCKVNADGIGGVISDVYVSKKGELFSVNVFTPYNISLSIPIKHVADGLEVQNPTIYHVKDYIFFLNDKLIEESYGRLHLILRNLNVHILADGIKYAAEIKEGEDNVVSGSIDDFNNNNNNDRLVFEYFTNAVTHSLFIARKFNMRHSDVIKRARLLASDYGYDDFIPSCYNDAKGQERPCFLLTEKAFNAFITSNMIYKDPKSVEIFLNKFIQHRMEVGVESILQA